MTRKEASTLDIVTNLPFLFYSSRPSQTESLQGHTIGHTTGVFIVTEVAPKICTLMRIQSIDFHASLPDPIINMLTKNEATKTKEVQDTHRRNDNEVDAEVREVIIAKMMKGVELDEVRMTRIQLPRDCRS